MLVHQYSWKGAGWMKKIFSKITKERKYQFQIETGILLENDIKYVEKIYYCFFNFHGSIDWA